MKNWASQPAIPRDGRSRGGSAWWCRAGRREPYLGIRRVIRHPSCESSPSTRRLTDAADRLGAGIRCPRGPAQAPRGWTGPGCATRGTGSSSGRHPQYRPSLSCLMDANLPANPQLLSLQSGTAEGFSRLRLARQRLRRQRVAARPLGLRRAASREHRHPSTVRGMPGLLTTPAPQRQHRTLSSHRPCSQINDLEPDDLRSLAPLLGHAAGASCCDLRSRRMGKTRVPAVVRERRCREFLQYCECG